MKAPVEYLPDFVSHKDEVLRSLLDLPYERRGETPRSECFFSDHPYPYAYGRGEGRRTYLPNTWPDFILPIRKALETRYKCIFDVCFANRYHDQKDHLGWHADDSPEMDDARPIVTVSFGVEREIWFRPLLDGKPDKRPEIVERLTLGHGSACTMFPGMQDAWQHRIPKASFNCGDRVSLVFRGYVKP